MMTNGERIAELRKKKGITQKQLADGIGLSVSQLSRIESGETATISSDVLVKIARRLNVSTDYILGLTSIKARKNYDISQTGLSEKSLYRLMAKKIDPETLNLLMEHSAFPSLMRQIEMCIAVSNEAEKELYDQPFEESIQLVEERIAGKQDDLRELDYMRDYLLAEKRRMKEACEMEAERIFSFMLKDLKKSCHAEMTPTETVRVEMMRSLRKRALRMGPRVRMPEHMAVLMTEELEKTFEMDQTSKTHFTLAMTGVFKILARKYQVDNTRKSWKRRR